MKKINILFFLLLPFIDVITALSTRFMNLPVSLGIIIKGLYILVLTLYIIFWSKSKNKKGYIIYIEVVALFGLLYFITKPDIINRMYLFTEITYLFKAVYASILFFGLLVLYDDNKLDNKLVNKLMIYSLFTYALLLIIPTLTNTNFDSYGVERNNEGSLGWFYAGNDISAIMLMLYPFIYSFIEKKFNISNKKTYLYLLLIIPVISSIYIIGTKTSWIGLVLLTLVLLIIGITKKSDKKNLILIGSILLILLPLTLVAPAIANTTKDIKETVGTKTTVKKEETPTATPKPTATPNPVPVCKVQKMNKVIKNKTLYRILNLGLSGRQNKAYTQLKLYGKSPILDKFFGIGFTNTSRINDCNNEKYVEIDLLDIFIHYGIIGLLVIIYPFIYVIKSFITSKTKDKELITYFVVSIIMILISMVAGHIIGYPSSGIYLSIYLLLIIMNIEEKKIS